MLLHLGPNVITFRTLLHLGQLLHLGLQHACFFLCRLRVNKRADLFKTNLTLVFLMSSTLVLASEARFRHLRMRIRCVRFFTIATCSSRLSDSGCSRMQI